MSAVRWREAEEVLMDWACPRKGNNWRIRVMDSINRREVV